MACSCCGIVTTCCPGLSTTLHVTVSGSGACGFDGTYAIVWNSGQSAWIYDNSPTLKLVFFCNSGGTSGCNFWLQLSANGQSNCWQIFNGCGAGQNQWASANCSTPAWTSNATAAFCGGTCVAGVLITCSVGP